MWRVLSAAIIGMVVFPPSVRARQTAVLRPHNIRITCDSAEALESWKAFLGVCVASTESVLGPLPGAPRMLSITFGAVGASSRGPFELHVHPRDSMVSVTDRLCRALILRALVRDHREHAPVIGSLAWVSAAITNRVLFRTEEPSGVSRPDYQPARFLFSRGRYPDVIHLIESPVSVEHTVLFRLYALHCDLLALCLWDSAGAGVIGRLLEHEAHGRPATEALMFLLQDVFAPGDNLQSWYERTVVQVSRRGRRLSDGETIAQRLDDLLTVPVVAPGRSDFRGQRMPIEEVPEKLDAFKVDAQAMARLQAELYELLKDAPELLRPPLAGYMEACAALAAGKTRSARRQFREIRAQFSEALTRQQAVESYLDELERDYVPAERRLGIYLDVIRERAAAERQLAPRLHEYLDQVAE